MNAAERVVRELRDSARSVEQRAEDAPLPFEGQLSVGTLIRETARRTNRHHLAAFAGNLTYNAFLAIFPFLLFLVSILKLVHATSLMVHLVSVASTGLPRAAARTLHQQIVPDVFSRLTSSPILSVLLAIGSLWAISAVARAGTGAINTMYGAKGRGLVAEVLVSIVLSLVAAALFLAALALILLGPLSANWIGQTIGYGSILGWMWQIGQWPVLVALVALAFAVIYYYAPNVRIPLRSVLPGAIGATLVWLVFSVAFALVLNRFGRNLVAPLYGWFTGWIILLMYMYWSSLIVLVGAQVNQVLLRHHRTRRTP